MTIELFTTMRVSNQVVGYAMIILQKGKSTLGVCYIVAMCSHTNVEGDMC